MSAGRRSVLALVAVLAAAGASGCGGGSGSATTVDSNDTTPGNGATVPTQSVPSDLALPRDVPRRATGPAQPAA